MAVGLVRVAIVTAVVVVTLAAAHSSVETTSSLTSPASGRAWTAQYDQQTCLQADLERSVPKGADVYLVTPNFHAFREGGNVYVVTPHFRSGDDLIHEGVLVASWAHPTTATAAQWTIAIQPEPRACSGLGLRVQKI